MSDKRRLSHGSSVHDLHCEDEDFDLDDDFHDDKGRRSIGSTASKSSRRQSFGSALSSARNSKNSAQEQSRIADMYKMVIKLSNENKITAKNSWNLDLIDHMGQIIKDENKKGCNFQKASCTLDASIKIYSHRVDDTWAGSLRILENLSRNGGDYDEDADDRGLDEEDADPSKPRRVAKVGSKSTSARLGLTNTIEKNPKTLNMTKVDGESATDPMFQKMSMAFDEGGAKGMLMNNLRVSPDSCSMVFSSLDVADTKDKPAPTTKPTPVTNNCLRDLLTRLNVTPTSIADTQICPGLAEYRRGIGMNAGVLDAFTPLPAPIVSVLAAPDTEQLSSSGAGAAGPAFQSEQDDGAYCGDDYGGDDDNEYAGGGTDMAPSSPLAAVATSEAGAAGSSKWAQLFGGASTEDGSAPVSAGSSAASSPAKEMVERTTRSLEWNALGVSNANDYSFFNMNSLVSASGEGNKWAGARHWKFATRRARAQPVETAEATFDVETVATAKPKLPKAKSTLFDFADATPLDPALFAAPVVTKRKANSTIFSDAVLSKQATEAASGAYTLPEDSKIQLQDLCRLFLRPNMIAPPANMLAFFQPKSGSGDQAAGSKYASSSSSGKPDLIWGVLASKESTVLESVSVEHVVDADHYMTESGDIICNGGDGGGDDDDNDYYASEPTADDEDTDAVVASLTESLASGLKINTSKLVQASRTVGKVNVGYATSAKLVNVRKLKTDIWSAIETSSEYQAPPTKEVPEDKENASGSRRKAAAPVDKYETLSFQNVVKGVATAPATKQKDASLSFYFISLLHLANEKNLCLTGNPAMNDLCISK